MNILKSIALPLALVFSLGLAACGTIAQLGTTVAVELSSSTPAQVRTLGEAYNAATVLTEAVRVYVEIGNPDRATLLQLRKLNDDVKTALDNLNAANKAGQSLVFAGFNEALRAFNSYATAKGIPH